MPRYGPWIQDPDVVINLTSPAGIRAALNALGYNYLVNLIAIRSPRIRAAAINGTGDGTYDPAGGPVADFAALCDGQGDPSAFSLPVPDGIAVSAVENDLANSDSTSPVPAYANSANPPTGDWTDPYWNPAGEVPMFGPLRDPSADAVLGAVVQTPMVARYNRLIPWTFPDLPDNAIGIQALLDAGPGDPVDFNFDDGLTTAISVAMQFQQTSRDHYAFDSHPEFDGSGNHYVHYDAAIDPTAISVDDTFELRDATGEAAPETTFETATVLAGLPLLDSAPVTAIGTTAPPGSFDGPDIASGGDEIPQSTYDFSNAADIPPPLTLAFDTDRLAAVYVASLASQRTRTAPPDPGQGPLLDPFWQPGMLSWAAVAALPPDGTVDQTVTSIAFTWRPPQYRFIYEGPIYVRQRQAGSAVRQRQNAARPERQRQQRR